LERKFYFPELISADEVVRALMEKNTINVPGLVKKIASITLRAFNE